MKKAKVIPITIFILITLLLLELSGCAFTTPKIESVPMYLASASDQVQTYTFDKQEGEYEEAEKLPRGTEVDYQRRIDGGEADEEYCKVLLGETEYFVERASLCAEYADAVKESVMWVRTPVTLYENDSDPSIAGYAPKGSKINVIGFDYIKEDGSVNMYQADYEGMNCWVYAKYLLPDESSALADNEAYTMIHRGRKWEGGELYGGEGEHLDYYPVEKPIFEDNKPLEYSNAMFLLYWKVWELDPFLELAKANGVNAIVLDIKSGPLGYKSDVACEYCPTAYDRAFLSKEDYKYMTDKIKSMGFYLIGRIVTFNDSDYAADHPDECIKSSASTSVWPSAYSRGAWEYNVRLACEAASEFGFDEIQFDYVRFPSNSYQLSKCSDTDFKNVYGEEMAQCIQNFLFYACDQIHKEHAYVSADVFGESSNDYVTAYGQYWPAISNVVDVTSSMPYTDHFSENPSDWTDPYTTIYNWGLKTVERQKEIPTPSIARTWITCYDTPYWGPTVFCDSDYLLKQIHALKDAGLDGGFMPWNGSGTLKKYQAVSDAWLDYSKQE